MKEFIEKLIGRLEENGQKMSEAKPCVPYGKHSPSNHRYYKAISVKKAINIINQLAEEYKNESVKINADYIRNMTNDELATFLSSIDHITDGGDRIVVFEGEAMHDNIVDIEIWLKEKREPKGK